MKLIERYIWYWVIAFLLLSFIVCSTWIVRNDTDSRLVLSSFSGIVKLQADVNQWIISVTRRFRPQILTLALLPGMLLLVGLILSRISGKSPHLLRDNLFIPVLLSFPYLYVFLDYSNRRQFWRFRWQAAIAILFAGMYFAVKENRHSTEKFAESDAKTLSSPGTILIFSTIIVIAYLFRVVWLDELPKFFDADALYDMNDLLRNVFDKQHSPLWYFLIPRRFYTADEAWYMCLAGYAFKFWGISLLSIRLTTVFYGLITVALWFQLNAYLFNRSFALLTTFILSVLPFHVAYSRYGHTFLMPLILFIAASLFAFRFLHTRKFKFLLFSGFTMGWCYAFHLSSLTVLFLVPAILLTGISERKFFRKMKMKVVFWFVFGAVIGSAGFWMNIQHHRFQETCEKAVANSKTDAIQFLRLAGDHILSNAKVLSRFFMDEHGPSRFFRGATQYFPPRPEHPAFFALLIGLAFFGAGYCLANWKDHRLRYFLFLALFVPVPGMLSRPYDKRIIGLSLVFCGLSSVTVFLTGKYLNKFVPGGKWIYRTGLFLFLLVLYLNATWVVFAPEKDHRKNFYFNFAKELNRMISPKNLIYAELSNDGRAAANLFTRQKILRLGGNPSEYYVPFQWRTLLYKLVLFPPRTDRVTLFLQTSDHQKTNIEKINMLKELWPIAAIQEQKDFLTAELDVSTLSEIWGLRPERIVYLKGELPDIRHAWLNKSDAELSASSRAREGYLVIPVTDEYSFSLKSSGADSACRVIIDNSEIILRSKQRGPLQWNRPAPLDQGLHEIRIIPDPQHSDPLKVYWKSGKIVPGPIPFTAFYPSSFKQNQVAEKLFHL